MKPVRLLFCLGRYDRSYGMDLARLRDVLGPHVVALKDACTHDSLSTICEKLGLQVLTAKGLSGKG